MSMELLEKTGIPTDDMIRSAFPPVERINRGRVAVAECYQNIPCNPCQSSCGFSAITVGEDINNTPKVTFDKCVGCGACLTKCPGLAIMLVDGRNEDCIEFSIPYELLPLPEVGETVDALDRSGEYVTEAEVTQVLNQKGFDRTPIVRFRVPREHLYTVRNIRLRRGS